MELHLFDAERVTGQGPGPAAASCQFLAAHLGEVRRHLEIPAARLAAHRRTQHDLDELLGLVALFDATDDPAERAELDALLHIAVARATGNPLLPRLIEDLRVVLRDQRVMAPGWADGASAEHRAIVAAIADGDADLAETAMRRHLATADGAVAHDIAADDAAAHNVAADGVAAHSAVSDAGGISADGAVGTTEPR